MERRYKAFISYRHLPLEASVAKKMHRRIEHYIVPKELRKGGEKKLGLVFRDQDELPIASDLTENIEQALDRSEFLIVICSPETAKSPWVLREIDYFLKHHDRDHILAVLADGRPEEAFPPQMTEIRDESGKLGGRIEPIAANIVAPTRAKRDKLFRIESLRILAALIGCHFDALYRREQRYRRRRTAAGLTAAGLIAAAFIGMLLNRNAQIRAQLQQTQINESRALSALSERAYGEGDYLGALRLALEALPGAGRDRPYVAEAERALSGELDLYRRGVIGYASSVEQDTMIQYLALSEDGTTLATADSYGTIRAYDAATGAERWQRSTDGQSMIFLPREAGGVLASGGKGSALYALADGAELWSRDDLDGLNFGGFSPSFSPSGRLGLLFCYDESAQIETETVALIDLKTGKTLNEYPIGPGPGRLCAAAAIDGQETRAAFVLKDAQSMTASLCLLSLADGEVRTLEAGLPYSVGAERYRVLFTEEGDVLLGCDSMAGASAIRLYERGKDYALRFETPIETEQVAQVVNSGVSLFPSLDLLDCRAGRIAAGSKHELYMLDAGSGGILWHRTLPGTILAAKMYANACLGLTLSDGTVTFCTDAGSLSYTQGVYSFSSGYALNAAAMQGDAYWNGAFVLTPDGYRRRAVVVRFLDNPAMHQIAGVGKDVARTILIPSDTGARIACIGYDPTYRAACCTMLDAVEGSTGETFALPAPELWALPDLLRLTDGGVLLSPGHALDTNTLALTETEAEPLPAGIGENAVWARGGSRLALLEGRTITVRDAGSGGTLCTIEAFPAVCKLLFARGDELLIAFSETGTLCVYDAESGKLLHSSEHGEKNLLFSGRFARYSVSEIPEEKRMLVFCDSLGRSEAVCIALDTESWDCVGVYEGAAACLAGTNYMLVSPYLDGVWLCPRWTLQEMMEKAETILAAAEGNAESGKGA